MRKRAELFLKDWAFQNVGRGDPLKMQDAETAEWVARLLAAARDSGVPEAALRELTVLGSLIVGARALANGVPIVVSPRVSQRMS